MIVFGKRCLCVDDASARCLRPRNLTQRISGGSLTSARVTFVGVIFLSPSASLAAEFWKFSIFFSIEVAVRVVNVYAVFDSGTDKVFVK